MKGPVGFLFLGETLLIPHLFPIVEALAHKAPDIAIDLWVSTSVHEALLGRWIEDLPNVRIRRAPGFRKLVGYENGRNPPVPRKLTTLARLLPKIVRTPVVVSAEQTSLWLPALLPLRSRFVNTTHGAAPMSSRDDIRRGAAWRLLVPSEREQATYIARGHSPDYVRVTGYVKAAFRQRTSARLAFPEQRPIILYTPHWQRFRSSWWDWGERVIDMLVAQDRFNVILAPHQRLVEKAPELRSVLARAAEAPHVHSDIDSFAMIDGSYTAAADIYLGDTSSQVSEFMMRPRPCVFLNNAGADWRNDESYDFWHYGEVVDDLGDLFAAVDRSIAGHPKVAEGQAQFTRTWLGDTSGAAPERVAEHVLEALTSR